MLPAEIKRHRFTAAAPEGRARALVRPLRRGGTSAAVVGEVVEGAGVRLAV